VSDRQDEVLNSIDAALAQCICGQPIPENGPSLDYCSDVCQHRFDAGQAGIEPDPELLYPIPAADTDGRRINNAVNGWINGRPSDSYYGELEPYLSRRTPDRFSFTRAAGSDSIPARLSDPTGPDLAATTADWVHAVLGGESDRLYPWQMRMLSDVISAGPGRLEIETRGRNVMGPRGFIRSGDSIPVHLSPGEAMIPGPNGPIHIRGAYGDLPMQVTEVDLDDMD
jgi:hypothetical protein